ncbi:MAG: hypothetical protein U0401_14915 [Anaerolineae bacterium]
MLSETILYNNRIWFIIMLLIVTVMFCGFNSATIKAERLGANASETSLANAPLPDSNSQSAPLEPIPTALIGPGFYRHPSDVFSFDLPDGWQLVSETDTMAVFMRNQAELGALFSYVGQDADAKRLPDFRDTFMAGFLNFADDYTIVREELQPDHCTIFTVRYHSAVEGDGQVNFFFRQRETAMFVLYLRTPIPAADEAAWAEVLASYTVK